VAEQSAKPPPPARVRVILARAAPVAAVFRRGPSRWTLLLRWHTDTDQIEAGDWFRGRIYEHRCDLTPDGKHLVYFAATYGGELRDFPYGYAWTGVCEPPSLRPIGFWSKGDAWFGGGLFEDQHHLWINQPAVWRSPFAAKKDDNLRSRFTVTFNANARGGDEPIYGMRRTRDGWALVQEPTIERLAEGFTSPVPEVREKAGPNSGLLRWTRALEGYHWVESYELISDSIQRWHLAGAEWADWDHHGRLVFAKAGRLCEATVVEEALVEREVADLNGLQPQEAAAQ
jgi:hypothetical protein